MLQFDEYKVKLNNLTPALQELAQALDGVNGKKKYGPESFITVCPTCHAVLHRIRPWRTRKDCCTILC